MCYYFLSLQINDILSKHFPSNLKSISNRILLMVKRIELYDEFMEKHN